MPRKQKVKFHKGDRRPGGFSGNLKYTVDMVKKRRRIVWQVVESPSNNIIFETFFEEDAQSIAKFQNKNQVWKYNGGVPSFLCVK
jgi:hypothetical protein